MRIARHSKTGQYAAIKIISKSTLPSQVSLHRLADEVERIHLAIEREIVVMKLIKHPNIMSLYDVWETSTELYLVLEYVQGGELFHHLTNNGPLATPVALSCFQQIISAVDYCHRFNIAHRDLKPENLLLDQDFNIKIADFGMAAWQVNAQGGLLRTSCGSPHYAAPEVVSGTLYKGSSADIWSCGIILFAMLTGNLPFDDEDIPTLLSKIIKGSFIMPRDIDPLAQNLIGRMLTSDVTLRITMPEIMRHPFFVSAPPKLSEFSMPNLDNISVPIASRSAIDPDIFANIRTLWHGTSDAEIVNNLVSEERNWQKAIYHLLVEYREQHLSTYEQEEYDVLQRRIKRRKVKKEQLESLQRNQERPFPSMPDLPPRDEHPTPRKARQYGNRSTASEDSLFRLNLAQSEIARAQSSSSQVTPLSPIWDALNIPPLTVPELQDTQVQAFLHQITSHLTVLRAKHGATDIDEVSLTPFSPGKADYPENRPLETIYRPLSPAQGHRLEEDILPADTMPLTVRRKAGRTVSDKENSRVSQTAHAIGNVHKRLSLQTPQTQDKSVGEGAKRATIHIVEPFTRTRSKLKKKRHASGASSDFSVAGSSFQLASPSPSSPVSTSPKRHWFGNILGFKPVTYSLLSTRDLHTSRSECRRLLMEMNILVSLEDPDGLGILKCRTNDIRDALGANKAIRFRVEMQPPLVRLQQEGCLVSLLLVHEKGSTDMFKKVVSCLRKSWSMDNLKCLAERQ